METSQMSQQSLQHQETFSSSKSSQEVYEGTEFGSGVLKGYKLKEDALMNGGYEVVDGQQHQFLKDNGIFGGITGDHNSLVEEVDEVDYKRHSVKSLVGHFAKVKPKAEIPVQYLPEQRMYNGEQGPTLNYLSTKSESSSSAQSTLQRSTVSKQDSDVSRQEYEARKQASQQTVQNTQSSTSVSSSQKNSVEIRKKSSEMTEEQKQQLSQRRQSLKDYLLMDPAAEHAKAGIIDPSAILRGEQHTTTKTSLRPMSSSPSSKMYISKPVGPKPFGSTLPRSYKSSSNFLNSQAISQQMSSPPAPTIPTISTEFVDSSPSTSEPLVPLSNPQDGVSASFYSKDNLVSSPSPASLLIPSESEYQATVQTSSKKFEPESFPVNPTSGQIEPQSHSIDPIPDQLEPQSLSSVDPILTVSTNNTPGQFLTNTNTHIFQSTAIESSSTTLDYLSEDLQPAVSIPLPLVPRSTANTPLPTNPFPPPDSLTITTSAAFNPHDLLTLPTSSSFSCQDLVSTSLPPSSLSLHPPRTPLLVTTRPSSVADPRRAPHMSKDDIARMMAELNAPLPPMVPIPQDIRASPLIFCSRGPITSLAGSKI